MKPDLRKLEQEQLKIASKAIFIDQKAKFLLIGGCDQINYMDKVICEIVVLDSKTLNIVEKKYSVKKVDCEYLPAFMAYRQMPAILDAFSKLEHKPDVLIMKGFGILHPRKAGVATHIGVVLDMPVIGIEKKLICGIEKQGTIYLGKEAVGKALVTKGGTNPIYVSPGNKTTLNKSVELVKSLLHNYKLPLPLHLAHKYAVKVKNNLSKINSEKE